MRGRKLKQRILQLLQAEDWTGSLAPIAGLPARQAVNPLFSFFYNRDERIKWRAVTAMGVVVAHLAESDIESARVVMRRLMWNLNDESGGIGWGSPEAMGEIMARSGRLAREYSCILISYIDPKGNYLEHSMLQRGVLWGLGRLAHARPRYVTAATPLFLPFLVAGDAMHRGLAVWAAGPLAAESVKGAIRHLTGDGTRVKIFIDADLVETSVGRLAKDALQYF